MQGISVVIPTYNEADNISLLVKRLVNSLKPIDGPYEIIFVDDHSSDRTTEHIKAFIHQGLPVKLYLKRGPQGKAFSLLEGFGWAQYEHIAMIDADLQYPPEAVPEMYQVMEAVSADVVVARRFYDSGPFMRKLASRVFALVFAQLLHGLDLDVQSGLKLFKRELLERITVKPTGWTFDLDFLLQAKSAGYHIAEHTIHFADRNAGKPKVRLLKGTIEIGWAALKLKFLDQGIIPFSQAMIAAEGQGFHYKGKKYVHHSNLPGNENAFIRITPLQKITLIMLLGLLSVGLLLNWQITLIVLLALLTFVYFVDLLFILLLVYRSFSDTIEITVPNESLASIPEDAWPTYTIFCPLYKEWEVLGQFITAMSKLDYPKDKLQIMLLLEEDDIETIGHARSYSLPDYFKVVVIPHSIPKTKPKALNYGLKLAKGEYCVIYDAEDVPDPLQLKKAVVAFAKAPSHTICVQAKLNFYNPHQNLLTRLFTSEYSLWFDLVLTGLQSIGAPIPLGGTSNHFKTADVHKLKGWDAFNVTEDCDLGMRLAKQGYITAIVDSVTLEEANSSIRNWFHQRSRWIKGYIQTYWVHMRKPGAFITSWKDLKFITFQLVVGGKVLSMFVNPFLWVVTFSYFVFRPIVGHTIEQFFPPGIFYFAVFSLIIGNFLYFYYYMIGCAKRRQYELIPFAFFIPFYWLAMSMAAWIAVYSLLLRPHHWAKTQHGLHLQQEKVANTVKDVIGGELIDGHIASVEGSL